MQRRRPVVACPPVIRFVDHETGERDSFVKHRLLGHGGFAAVYEVERASDGCRMAAKVLPLSSLADPNKLRRVQNEIDVNQLLHHAHVATFLGSFQDEHNVYLMQELCTMTLSELLKHVGRFSEREAAHILWQVVSALDHLHTQGVCHRDLKLSNMFIARDGTVRVGDLGLACHLPTPTSRRHSTCGSLNWMAPEVLVPGPHGYGLEVDLWSLGVVLYALLLGRPPFTVEVYAEAGGAPGRLPAMYARILAGHFEVPLHSEPPTPPGGSSRGEARAEEEQQQQQLGGKRVREGEEGRRSVAGSVQEEGQQGSGREALAGRSGGGDDMAVGEGASGGLLSAEACDLIGQLLRVAPESRPSLAAVRSHPFFARHLGPEVLEGHRAWEEQQRQAREAWMREQGQDRGPGRTGQEAQQQQRRMVGALAPPPAVDLRTVLCGAALAALVAGPVRRRRRRGGTAGGGTADGEEDADGGAGASGGGGEGSYSSSGSYMEQSQSERGSLPSAVTGTTGTVLTGPNGSLQHAGTGSTSVGGSQGAGADWASAGRASGTLESQHSGVSAAHLATPLGHDRVAAAHTQHAHDTAMHRSHSQSHPHVARRRSPTHLPAAASHSHHPHDTHTHTHTRSNLHSQLHRHRHHRRSTPTALGPYHRSQKSPDSHRQAIDPLLLNTSSAPHPGQQLQHHHHVPHNPNHHLEPHKRPRHDSPPDGPNSYPDADAGPRRLQSAMAARGTVPNPLRAHRSRASVSWRAVDTEAEGTGPGTGACSTDPGGEAVGAEVQAAAPARRLHRSRTGAHVRIAGEEGQQQEGRGQRLLAAHRHSRPRAKSGSAAAQGVGLEGQRGGTFRRSLHLPTWELLLRLSDGTPDGGAEGPCSAGGGESGGTVLSPTSPPQAVGVSAFRSALHGRQVPWFGSRLHGHVPTQRAAAEGGAVRPGGVAGSSADASSSAGTGAGGVGVRVGDAGVRGVVGASRATAGTRERPGFASSPLRNRSSPEVRASTGVAGGAGGGAAAGKWRCAACEGARSQLLRSYTCVSGSLSPQPGQCRCQPTAAALVSPQPHRLMPPAGISSTGQKLFGQRPSLESGSSGQQRGVEQQLQQQQPQQQGPVTHPLPRHQQQEASLQQRHPLFRQHLKRLRRGSAIDPRAGGALAAALLSVTGAGGPVRSALLSLRQAHSTQAGSQLLPGTGTSGGDAASTATPSAPDPPPAPPPAVPWAALSLPPGTSSAAFLPLPLPHLGAAGRSVGGGAAGRGSPVPRAWYDSYSDSDGTPRSGMDSLEAVLLGGVPLVQPHAPRVTNSSGSGVGASGGVPHAALRLGSPRVAAAAAAGRKLLPHDLLVAARSSAGGGGGSGVHTGRIMLRHARVSGVYSGVVGTLIGMGSTPGTPLLGAAAVAAALTGTTSAPMAALCRQALLVGGDSADEMQRGGEQRGQRQQQQQESKSRMGAHEVSRHGMGVQEVPAADATRDRPSDSGVSVDGAEAERRSGGLCARAVSVTAASAALLEQLATGGDGDGGGGGGGVGCEADGSLRHPTVDMLARQGLAVLGPVSRSYDVGSPGGQEMASPFSSSSMVEHALRLAMRQGSGDPRVSNGSRVTSAALARERGRAAAAEQPGAAGEAAALEGELDGPYWRGRAQVQAPVQQAVQEQQLQRQQQQQQHGGQQGWFGRGGGGHGLRIRLRRSSGSRGDPGSPSGGPGEGGPSPHIMNHPWRVMWRQLLEQSRQASPAAEDGEGSSSGGESSGIAGGAVPQHEDGQLWVGGLAEPAGQGPWKGVLQPPDREAGVPYQSHHRPAPLLQHQYPHIGPHRNHQHNHNYQRQHSAFPGEDSEAVEITARVAICSAEASPACPPSSLPTTSALHPHPLPLLHPHTVPPHPSRAPPAHRLAFPPGDAAAARAAAAATAAGSTTTEGTQRTRGSFEVQQVLRQLESMEVDDADVAGMLLLPVGDSRGADSGASSGPGPTDLSLPLPPLARPLPSVNPGSGAADPGGPAGLGRQAGSGAPSRSLTGSTALSFPTRSQPSIHAAALAAAAHQEHTQPQLPRAHQPVELQLQRSLTGAVGAAGGGARGPQGPSGLSGIAGIGPSKSASAAQQLQGAHNASTTGQSSSGPAVPAAAAAQPLEAAGAALARQQADSPDSPFSSAAQLPSPTAPHQYPAAASPIAPALGSPNKARGGVGSASGVLGGGGGGGGGLGLLLLPSDLEPELDPDALALLAERLRSKSFTMGGSRQGSFSHRPTRMMPAAHRSPPRQQTEDGAPSPREAASPLCAPRARAVTARGITRSHSRSPAASPRRARAALAASAPGMLPLFPSAPGNLGLYGNGSGSSRAHASAAAAPAGAGQTHGSAGDPRSVLLVKWLDYSSKYGLSYLLSNGTVGMVFRDGSQMVHVKGTTWAWFYPAPSSQEVQEPHPEGHRAATAATGLSYLGPAPPGYTSSSSSAVTAAAPTALRPAPQHPVPRRQQQPVLQPQAGVQPQALPADVEELAELEAAAALRRRHGGNGAIAGFNAVGGRDAGAGHAVAAPRGSASSSRELTKKLKLLLGFQRKMLDKPGQGGLGGGGGGAQGALAAHGLGEGREDLAEEDEDEEDDVAQRRVLQRRRPLGVHGPPPEVRVVSWARTHKALVVCLSSGTVQGLFADGSEVVMREADDEVLFLSRDGRRHACSLRGVRQAGARHSITKRLDYIALLLQQAASTAAAAAGTAAAAAGGAR